jgi:hypothetical protein
MRTLRVNARFYETPFEKYGIPIALTNHTYMNIWRISVLEGTVSE